MPAGRGRRFDAIKTHRKIILWLCDWWRKPQSVNRSLFHSRVFVCWFFLSQRFLSPPANVTWRIQLQRKETKLFNIFHEISIFLYKKRQIKGWHLHISSSSSSSHRNDIYKITTTSSYLLYSTILCISGRNEFVFSRMECQIARDSESCGVWVWIQFK